MPSERSPSPQERRYQEDRTFRALVDLLEWLMQGSKTTPFEMLDALLLAITHYLGRR